jgi:hypothetical protein
VRWRRSKKLVRKPGVQPVDHALQQSQERLDRVRSRTEEVIEITEDLRKHREADDYTEMIRRSMRRI